jgi:hypothetical protein
MASHSVDSRLRPRSASTKNSQAPKDTISKSRDETEGECHDACCTVGANTVAIVGAGFAGLILANYLELPQRGAGERQKNEEGINQAANNHRWTYKLFESKSSTGIPIIGTIGLESAREILEELCLFEEACSEQNVVGWVFPKRSLNTRISATNSENDDNFHEVSRESFLELLRKNVTIQSSSRVVDIIEKTTNDGSESKILSSSYFIVTEGDGREREEHGPFDLVVAANGLSFRGETTKTLRQKLKSSSSILKIGDSRYHYDRSWWDFDFLGATRRRNGADVAIRDGLLIGRRLLGLDPLLKSQDNREFYRLRFRGGVSNGEFSTAEILSQSSQIGRMIMNRGKELNLMKIVVAIFLPILLALIFYS